MGAVEWEERGLRCCQMVWSNVLFSSFPSLAKVDQNGALITGNPASNTAFNMLLENIEKACRPLKFTVQDEEANR